MKSTKIALLSLALLATVACQLNASATKSIYPSLNSEQVVDKEKEAIIAATTIAQDKIKKAEVAINEARQKALNGEMTSAKAGKIIKNQSIIIAETKNALKKTIEQSVKKVEAADEQSYLSYFVSGAKDLGARAIAPFRSGYGYTEDEKKIHEESKM